MTSTPTIAILLSTYNGAAFLDVQLESVMEQTYKNLLLVVRDDGSSDDTRALLQKWQQRYPRLIHLASGCDDNLGASGSFAWLLEYTLSHKAELGLEQAYMMFCDQDDRWFADKVAIQVNAMLAAESNRQAQDQLPVLVHSDLRVVSEQEELIAESLVRYQGLEIDRNRFANMVISNLVTGCTALINESLARQAMPVPEDAIMHDWWLALVASAFGEVVYLDRALIHYRQHDSNTIGAKEFVRHQPGRLSFWQRVLSRRANVHLQEVARQAQCFRQRFGGQLSWRDRVALRLCSAMAVRTGVLQRVFYRLARRF